MDGFDDAFGSAAPPPLDEVDPAAEFLAKEQEELGDMGEDFGIPAATVIPAATYEDIPAFRDDEGGEEEEEEIPISVSANYSPEGDLFNMQPNQPDDLMASQMSHMNIKTEEPECLKVWKEEQEERLKKKDADEELKKNELRDKAKQELEDWYKHYEDQLEKSKTVNREREEEFVAEVGGMNHITPGSEWERVAKHCDFSAKAAGHTKDVSRMRSILLQLKQNPPVTTRE